MMSPRGVMQAISPPPTTVGGSPAFARGEVRWADVVRVVPDDTLTDHLDVGVRAEVLASTAPCEARERSWDALRHGRAPDHAWRQRTDPRVDRALALCWADRLAQARDQPFEEQIRLGERARWWDHRPYPVRVVTSEVAAELREASRAAEHAGELEEAYQLSHGSLLLAPKHAWERRRAERLRDARLGIEHTPTMSDRLFVALGWQDAG